MYLSLNFPSARSAPKRTGFHSKAIRFPFQSEQGLKLALRFPDRAPRIVGRAKETFARSNRNRTPVGTHRHPNGVVVQATCRSERLDRRRGGILAQVADQTVWGIHAGAYGEADTVFMDQSVIAIGWPLMGDLSGLPADRDAFKHRLAETYPGTKPGAIPTTAGMLFRFLHEMRTGEIVAYPGKRDRMIHLGRVIGGYAQSQQGSQEYVNRRAVRWERHVPRTHFTQGALNEIGSALSLFQIKTTSDEFLAALAGRADQIVDPSDDPSTGAVAVQVAESTETFIIKSLARELKGLPFEGFISHLLECLGYRVRSARVNQPGFDLIASKDHLGLEPPIIKVQVKSTEGTLGDPEVSQLYGKLSGGESALFVTLGSVTGKARDYEASKPNLRIIDGQELVQLILEVYEQIDSSYKSLIPLRRAYVPAPPEAG